MSGGYYQPKGRNVYRVWFPWHGKTIYLNKYLDGTPLYHEEQAKRVLEKIRAEVDQGVFDPSVWGKDRSLLFQTAWKIYMEQSPCGDSRSETRERIYETYLLPFFKDKSLKEIEEIHVKDWWSTIPKKFNPNYQRMIRDVLKAFFRFHKITRQKMIEWPKLSIPKKVPLWWSREEQGKVLSSLQPWHHPIFKFMFYYGCRPGEACHLKWTDLDTQKNLVTFRERKNEKDNQLPLDEGIKAVIDGQKIKNWKYVFCKRTGLSYTRQSLYTTLRDACEKAGMKMIPLKNAVRHSRASQLLEQGESTFVVARVLGNTPRVIEDTYGSISIKKVEEILRKESL